MALPHNRSAQTQLRVGRLTKAHGLKGGLKLELYTDDPDRRFTPGSSFALQVPESSAWHGRRVELAELRWYNGHPVGFFAGVTDRDAAETLVKAILWVDQDAEEAAEPDAWYDHELVGLDVVRDGETVGVIDRLEHLPAQDLLVVATGDREVLVPFVRALVPVVDVAARRVVVTPPEGLFEALPDDPDERDAEGPGAEGRVAEGPAAEGRRAGAAEGDAPSPVAAEAGTEVPPDAPPAVGDAAHEGSAAPAGEERPSSGGAGWRAPAKSGWRSGPAASARAGADEGSRR